MEAIPWTFPRVETDRRIRRDEHDSPSWTADPSDLGEKGLGSDRCSSTWNEITQSKLSEAKGRVDPVIEHEAHIRADVACADRELQGVG